ncbi:MAG TPA: trigger factor [Candidatus Paceibacterota bacterium]|nr:trigger factor [Candidatus Paceibacterota bacterium]
MQFSDIANSFSRKELPDSEVELTGEIPADAVLPYRERALKHLAEEIQLPGFRPGHVPPDMIVKKVGEVGVLEEAVEMLMQDLYPALLDAQKVDAIGRPQVKITKLAPGNPVGLTVVCAVYPDITLPKNWKTIGEGIPAEAATAATPEEVEQTIESLRQSRKTKKDDGTEELPEMTDEFAKTLGAFDTVAALKEQITKGIGEEKARAAKDARRGKIIDALLAKTEVAVPRIFVDSELEKILAQMREDIGRMGLKFEDYLKHTGKTEEAIRDEFRDQAKKRAKLQLTLNKIADAEKVEADQEAVEAEIKHALEHFPDANPELVRIHIETVLKNEKVLRMLEGDATPVTAAPHDHSHE